MIKKLLNSISFKIGFLFTSVFLILLLLLGYILYALFSQMFVDYITQDLLVRGNNHAKVLSDHFDDTTIKHVGLMEKNVATNVIVTDNNNEILTTSDPIDEEMQYYLDLDKSLFSNNILNSDWENFDYLATYSPINEGHGYVYMFYPTELIKETVVILKGLIAISSFGVILIALGVIILLTKKMATPLLNMKEATTKMALGDYKQALNEKGNDEVAQLAKSIQSLGEQLMYFENTRNEFLASVSHELRTPLTYIKGYSDILSKGVITSKEEEQKYLKIINEETKRISHLVNDLFELSKAQSGKLSIVKEKTNINILLEKVVHNLTPLADEKKVKMLFNSDATVFLNVDPIRMEQVFFNLIENAIKYTDVGAVTVTVIDNDQEVKIIVADTGIGIPHSDLPRIWDRFYRVDKSRTRKTGGTGLGLNVVKEIIKLHDGQIEISSVENKGTTIVIIFNRKDGTT